MGKAQKKTGKGRLDKYYKLAKEQGYRARSAFKLIQLNKKYSFLESARCCIDLCAAPGGWLQVASKYMPANSIIVGVDLVPIKPIPRVSTFTADITTPQCRNLIRGELKDWKADVVLHDGAPNVGTAWVQDAFSQSELVLMSLKLAVEFLMKGGVFITKVFRSSDYNSLIWVFNQLFGHVEATKPPSSRNVSAEIFVVCRDYLAPKHVDPKFLDPKHVFKDIVTSISATPGTDSAVNHAQANVFQPEKKRRQRSGYTDGDYTLFKSVPIDQFVNTNDPITLLGTVSQFTFESDEAKQWLALNVTTDDILFNCGDLKVLGKGDFKLLMKWRAAVRQEIGLDVKMNLTEEQTEPVESEENGDEQAIEDELERLNREAAARTKRERRKANEVKTRTIQRMQLQMTTPLEIGIEQADDALGGGRSDFLDLRDENAFVDNGLYREEGFHALLHDEYPHQPKTAFVEEAGERLAALEFELDGLYDSYKKRLSDKDSKLRAKEARKFNKEREETWRGLRDNGGYEDEDDDDEAGGWEYLEKVKDAEIDETSDLDSEDDDDQSIHKNNTEKRSRLNSMELQRPLKTRVVSAHDKTKEASTAALWFDQRIFKDVQVVNREDEDSSLYDMDVNSSDNASVNSNGATSSTEGIFEDTVMTSIENTEQQNIAGDKSVSLTTAEAITIAQQLVNREKTKTQLVNDGFNRYSLNSKDNLPAWFLDDEAKHYKPNIPITKEAVLALRTKERALDARPIKKIAEAKARKKLKAVQRLQKAMSKADGINQTADLSEREKANEIQKLMLKGLAKGKRKKEDVKVVVAKGVHKGLKGRPKGVKGRYTMVDARMKKELRARKKLQKQGSRRR